MKILKSTERQQIAIVVETRPEIVKLAPVIRILGPAARFLHSCRRRDEELSSVRGVRLSQPETLSGIYGEPRHVQIGKMAEQLRPMFAERPPAAALVEGTQTRSRLLRSRLVAFDAHATNTRRTH